MYFFTSVEFYIVLAVIAAAVVAMAARPADRGPALEYLLAGDLSTDVDPAEPSLSLACADDGSVTLVRRSVEGITDTGAVSLAVKVIGHDVHIEERVTPGRGLATAATDAWFVIKFLPPGRYHVRYNSQRTGLFSAFPFHVTPGLKTVKELHR